MRYWPEPSVTAVRTFSMSAGTGGFDGDAGQHGAGRVLDDARDRGLRMRQGGREYHA